MLDSAKNVFSGRVIKVNLERVTLPNGKKTELEMVHHPGGIAIIAIDTDGRICVLRQFRHAAKDWIWEIPAGKLEPDEELLSSAKRELQEETGVTATSWSKLGKTISSPGVFTEIIHLFCAKNLTIGEHQQEDEECIEIHWFTVDKIKQMIKEGEIYDAKTIVGLTLHLLKNDVE